MKKVMKGFLSLIFLMVVFSFFSISTWATVLIGKVANVTMTTANTEYSYAVPNGVGAMTIQSRGANDVKLSFVEGESGTTYFTVKSGTAYFETIISSFNNILYFQCTSAGEILEIIYWYN